MAIAKAKNLYTRVKGIRVHTGSHRVPEWSAETAEIQKLLIGRSALPSIIVRPPEREVDRPKNAPIRPLLATASTRVKPDWRASARSRYGHHQGYRRPKFG